MTTKSGKVAVGDLVSVCFPGKPHEHIGSVLEVGCTFHQEQDNDSDSQVVDVSIVRRDGIRVHFPVDSDTATVPPEMVKKMGDGADGEDGSSSPHRTGGRVMRSRRSLVTPSPNLSKEKKGRPGKKTKKNNIEEDKKPAAKRKRAETDPDPSVSSESESSIQGGLMMDTSEKEKEKKKGEPKIAKKKSSTVPRRKPAVIKSRHFKNEDEEEETTGEAGDSNMISLPVAIAPKTKKSADSRKSGKGKAPLIVLAEDSEAEEAAPNDLPVAEEDSEEEDRPFQVEYSVSSRSTCRRCDSVITKGELRISHVPLFRGKPGYRVYRHLPCAVFSEEIKKVSDVGGWRLLNKDDLKKLEERVRESSREREEENEELQPDELVQQAFTGELRPSPPGLVANLLPFQREGFSWMYQQEKMDSDVRGGILVRMY